MAWNAPVDCVAATRETPIIMLTARCEEQERLQAFEAGIDDYAARTNAGARQGRALATAPSVDAEAICRASLGPPQTRIEY